LLKLRQKRNARFNSSQVSAQPNEFQVLPGIAS
jgi:hypothetical protein